MLRQTYYAAGAGWSLLNEHRPIGTSIFDADWDICIILDSARADMTMEMWPESNSHVSRETKWSRGSVTTEWLANTFRQDRSKEIAETTFVTANPHSETVFRNKQWLTNQNDVAAPYPDCPAVDLDTFDGVYELWKTHATEHNAVPPETMADATIEAYRRHGDRVVAHWLQPHEPFIAPTARLVGGEPLRGNVWEAASEGEIQPYNLRQSYLANLQYAVQFVELVASVCNAKILVTADHGNAFGELGIWGHPFGWLQPAVRKVPWITLNGCALEEYEPDAVLDASKTEATVDDQLAALGYV